MPQQVLAARLAWLRLVLSHVCWPASKRRRGKKYRGGADMQGPSEKPQPRHFCAVPSNQGLFRSGLPAEPGRRREVPWAGAQGWQRP